MSARFLLLPFLGLALAAQGPTSRPADPARDTITVERVREAISFLASDELAGRDTPSAGLERAAEFLARRFEQAKLAPAAADGSFWHRYSADGFELDSSKVRATFHDGERAVVLEPGRDVRMWRGNKALAGEVEVLRADVDSAGTRALRQRLSGTKPVVLEVAEDSDLWRAATPPRTFLRAAGAAPWLLVRRGLLPPAAEDVPLRGTLDLPAATAKALPLRNVVALLPGTSKRDEIVLFSAHYDHIGIDLPVDGDAVRNGADDDATGTTAVLLLAEAFAQRQPRLPRTLAFVCFSGEEKGMLGSRAFANEPPFELKRVVADLNLEMLGRPEDCGRMHAWITGADLSDFSSIVATGLARAGIELVQHPQASSLFGASDNISLAQKGVVAHSISAGSLHPDYHQPGDEVGKLDLEHMTAVIRGLYEAGVEMATCEAPPAWNDKGKRVLEAGGRRR